MQVLVATLLTACDLRLAGKPTHAGRRKALLTLPEGGTPVVVERRPA